MGFTKLQAENCILKESRARKGISSSAGPLSGAPCPIPMLQLGGWPPRREGRPHFTPARLQELFSKKQSSFLISGEPSYTEHDFQQKQGVGSKVRNRKEPV